MIVAREGLRFIRKNRVLFAGAASILAIGLGASATAATALWSMIHSGVPGMLDAHFVTIGAATASHALQPISWQTFASLRSELQAGAMSAYAEPVDTRVECKSAVITLQVAAVSANFLSDGFTRRLEAGHIFAPTDEAAGGGVIILGAEAARRLFGSSAAAIDRYVRAKGVDLRVAGVMAADFHGLFQRHADAWVPAHFVTPIYFDAGLKSQGPETWRTIPVFYAITRMPTAGDFGRRIIHGEKLEALEGLATDPALRHQMENWFGLALFLSTALTVACCLSFGGLLLSRVPRQFNDVRLKRVLGAGTLELCLESLAGPVLIACTGFAGSVLVAFEARSVLSVYAGLSLQSLAVALAVQFPLTLFAALAMGLAPALRLLKESGAPQMGYTNSAAKRSSRILEWIVIGQVTCSIGACLVAVSLGVTAHRIARHTLGFETRNRSVLSIGAVSGKPFSYSTDSRGGSPLGRAYAQVLRRVSALPMVTGVALAVPAPLSSPPKSVMVVAPGSNSRAEQPVRLVAITPGYFDVSGTRMLSGTRLTTGLLDGDPSEAVVNEAFQKQLWGSARALGKPLTITFPEALGQVSLDVLVTGVAEDQKMAGPSHMAEPTIYVPLSGNVATAAVPADLIVEGNAPLSALQASVNSELASAFSALGVTRQFRLSDSLNVMTADDSRRFYLAASGAAAIAFVAFLALYTSLAYFVSSSRKELAIRIACGASAQQTFRTVMQKAVRCGVIACALFAGCWLLFGRAAASWAGVATDSAGAALAAAAGCFGAVVLISIFPALQASRTAPATWLRQ